MASPATWDHQVRSQLKMTKRAMSEPVAISVVHITTREHGDAPSLGSCWGPPGCPGKTAELLPSLTLGSTCWKADPVPGPDSTVALALVAGLQSISMGECGLSALHLSWESCPQGHELLWRASPTPPQLQHSREWTLHLAWAAHARAGPGE